MQHYTPMRHSIHDVEHAIPIYLPSSLLYFNTARTNSPSEVGSAEEFPPTDESVGTCTWRGMPGSLGTSSVSEVMLRYPARDTRGGRGARRAGETKHKWRERSSSRSDPPLWDHDVLTPFLTLVHLPPSIRKDQNHYLIRSDLKPHLLSVHSSLGQRYGGNDSVDT